MIPAFARIALAMGKPVAFHGVGVYPTVSRGLLRDIRSLSNRLELFTVRDRLSHETLAENGIVSELVPDLSASMSLPQADRATRSDLLGLNPGRPVVGLCLTAINQSLAAFTLGALPGLMDAMPDVQFCFAPMSQHPSNERHNDLLLARQLRERCEGLTIVDGWHHPSFYLDLFRQFDAGICSRFHSFLFANRVGTPIVPLPYSEKCFGWLSDYGLSAIPHTEAALIDGVQEALQVGSGKRSQEVA
jgi:polysaccharide pyruvyl transferase WcaK-like protein